MPAHSLIRSLVTRPVRRPKTTPVRKACGSVGQPIEALEDRTVPSFGTPLMNFASTGYTGVDPPDPDGAVGATQYVTGYNNSSGIFINVYNKATGAPIAGFQNKQLDTVTATNVGTGPATPGFGDPIIAYDHLANRWVLGEINDNFDGLSLFVSQTPDATGAYYHYNISMPNGPDYPHIGITQDAIFFGTNEGAPSTVYALNRTKMEAGQALTAADVQKKTAPALAGHGFQIMTPADLDGSAGPAGTSYFMRKNDDEVNTPGSANPTQDFLEVWAFHVDFATPANTTYTQVANLAVAEFDSDFNDPDTFSAIPQPSPGPDLDPLNEPIMNRLSYRNFGTYEVLLGNFVTDVDPSAGVRGAVRWFELRKVGAGPWTEYQEGTVDPGDGASRWMGAIAMDSAGNIALAYSIASATINPGLRYTGRQAGDPLGTMPLGEFTIVNGGGYNGSNRWGDYFDMSVDPSDDTTFWFTGMYGLANHDWQTQVAVLGFGGAVVSIDGSGNLLVTGSGIADNLTIKSNTTSSRYEISDPNNTLTTTVPGAIVVNANKLYIPFASVTGPSILLNTNGGNDKLTVDYSLGNFSRPVNWDAGTSTTAVLFVTAATVATETYTFTSRTAGAVVGSSVINYTAVGQIADSVVAANRVFNYTSTDGAITLGAATAGRDTIASTTGAAVTFTNPSGSIRVDANTGANTITVSPLDPGFAGTLFLNATGSDQSAIVETATGNLNVARQTINGGLGSVTLAADVAAGGGGDDGVGRLTVAGTTSVTGATITLRGADIDVSPGAVVGTTASTTALTIRSSLAGRPMSVGGTNNAAVSGVNLTSAELARLVTSAAGTVTFGDDTQTGNITFTAATPATTPGAATTVQQSEFGNGQILFDATAGTALNGNGGLVSLLPGLGSFSGILSPSNALISTNGFIARGVPLTLSLPFAPTPGQTITLVDDTGSPIAGAFSTLRDGGRIILTFGGTPYTFVTSYSGGGGSDLVLTAVFPTRTSATSSAGTTVYGQPVTLTATVTASAGSVAPTGRVEFFDLITGTDLGAGVLQSSVGATAVWAYTTRPTQLGVTASPAAHLIRAVFTGTGTFGSGLGDVPGGVTVTAAPLTVTGITADKLFDGTTAAPLNTAAASLAGVFPGDAVTLNASGATGTYASSAVGLRPVALSGLTLSGPQAGNYTLAQPTITGRIGRALPTRVAVGSVTGGVVSVFDKGTPLALFASPFGGFRGGIAAAMGDLNGDGVSDLVVVKSSGGPAEVKAYDGTNGTQLLNFFALPAGYTGGASLALADLDGNGRSQIVVGALTGTSIVAVYDGRTGALRTGFLAYPEAAVGVNVAAGNLDGTGIDRIVTGATGIAPLVRVFDGVGNRVRQFLAFDPGIASVGVTVGVGDLNSNGECKILVGTRVVGLDFALLFGGDGSGRIIRALPPALARLQGNAGGPQLSIADTNGDGLAELLVSVGSVAGTFVGPNLIPLNAAVLDPTFLNGSYIV